MKNPFKLSHALSNLHWNSLWFSVCIQWLTSTIIRGQPSARGSRNFLVWEVLDVHNLTPTGCNSYFGAAQKEFLWNTNDQKKPHLVDWVVVGRLTKEGGLGLTVVREMFAMLGKWLWRFAREQTSYG